MFVCTYMYMYIHISTRVCMFQFIHRYIHSICIYIHVFIYLCSYVYILEVVFVNVCISIDLSDYIYT